ncbi:MAG TPA: APC family permease [Xanthomonadaceae bacterium]|nr:APC family permease [Xanthomonadaceae bacterium]
MPDAFVPPPPAAPRLRRSVGRWQLLGLSINDVIGSGIYLLPAAAAALLGPASTWAVLLAGLAVALLVLCYAQAASQFDQPGGGYLYAREAFGPFGGFEVGWMLLLTRVATGAALANGLAAAVTHFWPAAAGGATRLGIVTIAIAALAWLNVVGVRGAARTAAVLAIGKLVPLVLFVVLGIFAADVVPASVPLGDVPAGDLARAALLLLFAYAGFENMPAAAGEYADPRRDVPFALLAMITIVTLVYVTVQWVALATLPGLAGSATPLVEAAARFGGTPLAWVLMVGAAVSILGTTNNTLLLGPRYLHAMAADGFGPRVFAGVHPRFQTPAAAIIALAAVALVLAWSGSFVQLALLSVVARLCTYITTAAAVLVLRRRNGGAGSWLPGGPVVPLAALALSIALLASATWRNLAAAALALAAGAVVYRFRRPPA